MYKTFKIGNTEVDCNVFDGVAEAAAAIDTKEETDVAESTMRADGWDVTITPVLCSDGSVIFYNLLATMKI